MDARAALEDRSITQGERIVELEQQLDEARKASTTTESKLAAAEQQLAQETVRVKEMEANIQCAAAHACCLFVVKISSSFIAHIEVTRDMPVLGNTLQPCVGNVLETHWPYST
jgi:multidrug resistance efflux pump